MTEFKVNPFATRYVCPGKLPWLAEEQHSLERLTRRFSQDLKCRAAIVGPHGTGKSTLLEHLVPRLGVVDFRQARGRRLESPAVWALPNDDGMNPESRREHKLIVWHALRRAESPAARVWSSRRFWQRDSVLVLDGFEQLNKLAQWLIILATRRRGMGLLVTGHAPVALPTLVGTEWSADLAQQIVELACESVGLEAAGEFADRRLLDRLLAEELGNMREVLMRLYDMFENRDLPNQPPACKVTQHS